MRYIFIILATFILYNFSFAQNRKYYNKLKDNKKQSIQYSKKLLNSLKSDNKTQLDQLLVIEGRIRKENELLNIINKELKLITSDLAVQKSKIEQFKLQLKEQKAQYAKLVNFSWQNVNIQRRMIYIMSANSFNSAYKRILYLKQLADFRKAAVSKIELSIQKLDSTVAGLELLHEEKASLTSEKSVVLDSLKSVKRSFDTLIERNNQQLDKLSKEMNLNQSKRDLVKAKVSKEIDKQESTRVKSNSTPVSNTALGRKFQARIHRHIWPLRKFVILHKFGDYRHPKFTNVVIKNDGLELGASPGATVHAIYDGKVTNIITIPSEGFSIIIKHGNYYSVYTNVAHPEVKVGTKVSIGQVIAYLTKGKKMSKMNFQIWHGKKRLNPSAWLKRP